MAEELIRLSVSEAAKFFGLEQRTIRRAMKSGLVSYVIVRGRYKINFKSLLQWSQSRTGLKNKLAKRGVGQFVDKWKITNTLFSPNPNIIKGSSQKNADDHAETDAADGRS